MRYFHPICIVALLFTTVSAAEWQQEPLSNGAKGEWRHLQEGMIRLYSYGSGTFKKAAEERTTIHRFYWKGKLALELTETDGKDDLYLGNVTKSFSDAGAETETWDYNKDGIVDAIRIGGLAEKSMHFFGRYKDGIFALAPTDISFTALWDYLQKNNSEPQR